MAKQNKFQNTSSVKPAAPYKGMIKDTNDSYFPDGTWTHAVNAANYTKDGDIGTLPNEQGNQFCASVPYTFIGRIYLFDQKWIVFSTDEVNSEFGLFDEDQCTYCPIARDTCFGFSKFHLITGISKKNFDCSWQIYFADGNNFDRSVNIGNPVNWPCPASVVSTQPYLDTEWPGIPYIQTCVTEPGFDPASGEGCVICTNNTPLRVDCNKIRLARLINSPCAEISKGLSGGNMPNGSYYVVIAYSINQQKVTDYFTPSNIQPIFAHQNLAGSITIDFTNLDTVFFEEFQLVIVSTISQQTTAKLVGYYSTNTGSITLDSIDLTTPNIPLEFIPIRSPIYATSDKISQVSDYMLRISPTTRFDFNYQPLANKIQAQWVAVEYPTNYYKNGGSNTSYLRDEVYAFWIRWVYETGEKSSSYHIPGRLPEDNIAGNLHCSLIDLDPTIPGNQPYGDLSIAPANQDNIEMQYPAPNNYQAKVFEVYNTAYMTGGPISIPQADGGIIVGRGKMGYWQSTEKYPNKPEIWDSSAYPWSNLACTLTPEVDLCGEYIRHHKMPDNKCVPHIKSFANNPVSNNGLYPDTEKIVILGVEFNNIRYPVDNNGVGIPGIIGYEILRGSREGNKSIIAKGIFNNVREHELDTQDIGSPPVAFPRKGLYQNYPYNPLGRDPSLTVYEDYPGSDGDTGLPNDPNDIMLEANRVKTDMYTFHSPDTTFREPFLGETEVKLYGEMMGDVFGNFSTVPDHPKHKMISDFAFIVAAFVGIGLAAVSIIGKRTIKRKSGYTFNVGDISRVAPTVVTYALTGTAAQAGTITTPPTYDLVPGVTAGPGSGMNAANAGIMTGMALGEQALGGLLPSFYEGIGGSLANSANGIGGTIGGSYDVDNEGSGSYYTNLLGGGLVSFAYHWASGTDAVIKLIEAFTTYEQYALMYKSSGNYSVFDPGLVCAPGNQRRMISSMFYLDNNIQNFVRTATLEKFTINNLYRNKCVFVELPVNLLPLTLPFAGGPDTIHGSAGTCLYGQQIPTIYPDNTVQVLKTVSSGFPADPFSQQLPADRLNNPLGDFWYRNPAAQFRTNSLSPYGALKFRNRNQYGQLELVRQIPATKCVVNLDTIPTSTQMNVLCTTPFIYSSGLIFGGDTYIGRYTEKNKFFYFSEWLNKMPDGTPIDYTLYYMIKYAKYWGDFTGFDINTFFSGITAAPGTFVSPQVLPNDFHNFDRGTIPGSPFNVTQAYFYLFQTAVRDFYVESEINIDLRDWGETDEERFYDPYKYTDLNRLFHPDIIKYDNYYKYDYSLSISRIFNNFISWGQMHPRYYDPLVAETCYQYYPNRILYSLPANLESVKDNWYAFLANNYKDFTSKITAVKQLGLNGAGIFFRNQSPVMFQGVDTLETDLGTKITIGDGGLFSQPLQYMSNADRSYEYGSCQDSMSILNTPIGIFYVSADQARIFKSDGQQLIPISDQGMKWWFTIYLPYQILVNFPDFALLDNPVAGVGCQAMYDNEYSLLYFSKRDFKLRPQYVGLVTYAGDDSFLVGNLRITLGDPTYFEDASWTISYDPAANQGTGAWISFHDWHPNHNIPSRTYFLTVLNDVPWLPVSDPRQHGMWKHNLRTDLFNNYYDHNFRFEIEFPFETDQTVNTVRSIEYLMECYIYQTNQYDKYNVLDFNFDNAIIHNIEQVSGILNLILHPKNDVLTSNAYPIINPASIDILYNKEEQKYRFNQFWDITDDRGEFTFPTVQRNIWITAANGYDMSLNVNNLNYAKDPLQHKKFRHYANFVRLYTRVDQNRIQNINALFKFMNTKELYSPR